MKMTIVTVVLHYAPNTFLEVILGKVITEHLYNCKMKYISAKTSKINRVVVKMALEIAKLIEFLPALDMCVEGMFICIQ